MEKIKFNFSEKKISEKNVCDLEKKYNFSFPEEIKEHYMNINGGSPNRKICYKDNVEYRVNYFLSIGRGVNSFDSIISNLKDDNVYPSWLIPFADDIGGNYFSFCISDDDYGAIYYYDHEKYDDNNERGIIKLFDSFIEFIDSLQEDMEDDESELSNEYGFVMTQEWLDSVMAANKKDMENRK